MSDGTADGEPNRVIAIANNKGGVFKTSLAVNVAGLLATQYKVLLVALDTQKESCAVDLGYLRRSDHGHSLAQALLGEVDSPAIISDVREGLDVVADGPALERVTAEFYQRVGRGEAEEGDSFALLRRFLTPEAAFYDFVILDCPPGNRILTEAAMGAARWLLIPTRADNGSTNSMGGTAEGFVNASEHNPDLQLMGVVLTNIGSSATTVRAQAQEHIHELFGEDTSGIVFEAFVRSAETASTQGRQVHKLAHELAQMRSIKPAAGVTARIKRAIAGPEQPARRAWQSNAQGLAEDYAAITQRLLTIVIESEKAS